MGADYLRWLRMLGMEAKVSRSTNDRILSQVQKDVLQCFKDIQPPGEGNELETLYLQTFEVMGEILAYMGGCEGEGSSAEPRLFFFGEQVLHSMVALSQAVSIPVRTRALRTMVKGMSACLELKYVSYPSTLWRDTLPLFLTCLKENLPQLESCR